MARAPGSRRQLGLLSVVLCLVSTFAVGDPQQEPRITLKEIHSRELSEAATRSMPAARLLADHGFEVRPPGLLPDFVTEVVREVPDLWRLRLEPDVRPETLEVTYELLSARGHRNRLSHREEGGSEIRVRVRPIRPSVLRRDRDHTIIHGGVVLELDVATARTAGTYLGTLTTTITHL